MSDSPFGELQTQLVKALVVAKELNAGPMRCRELSLAITKIEEAQHWVFAMYSLPTEVVEAFKETAE